MASAQYNDQLFEQALGSWQQLCSASALWPDKERQLQPLADLLSNHPREVSEALLFAGPNAVLDVIMSIMVSERTQLCSKVQAADLLSAVCSQSKACLLLSPGFVVERLMRCAYKGHSDARSAASRALWQLSCHHDFSPEVVSHAGNAFKVVELLAEDMQQGGSSTCMCALRATQNLLQTYASNGAGDAGDRIGGRVIEPLCNLLEPGHHEPAAAAAELLALLSQTAQNRARILAAGGIPRLIALMRHASSISASSHCGTGVCDSSPESSPVSTAMQRHTSVLAEAAAEAAMHAMAQIAKGDAKLCSELLGAHVVPELLLLLQSRVSCAAAALSLLGDLAALPEGRRAFQYANGFAVLAGVAQDCPEQQLCRLLNKATKSFGSNSSPASALEIQGLLCSPTLLSVLVHCCRPGHRKTRKRAMQVLLRVLEIDSSKPGVHAIAGLQEEQQLQVQLVQLGLLQHVQAILAAQHHTGIAQTTLLEVQLAIGLLHGISACREVLSSTAAAAAAEVLAAPVPAPAETAAAVVKDDVPVQLMVKVCLPHKLSDVGHQQRDQANDEQQLGQEQMAARQSATAAAIIGAPSLVWKHPAAAAAAFGDMKQLLQQDGAQGTSKDSSTDTAATVLQQPPGCWKSLMWLLQQLLLSPHSPSSLQQQVLQVVAAVAAHKDAGLLQLMVKQGWVQVLWSFLPGGRQLLAVVMSQLLQGKQQLQQQSFNPGGSATFIQADTNGSSNAGSGAGVTASRDLAAAGDADVATAHAAENRRSTSSSLQPHLLQLLDDSLPSMEQTLHALQALAHLCSEPAAAIVAVQLQVSYTEASVAGLLALTSNVPAGTPRSEQAVVEMLFGRMGFGSNGPSHMQQQLLVRSNSISQLHSPRHLPTTPRSVSSASTNSTGVPASGSTIGASTSTASSISSVGGSSSLGRSSSTGFLSRLGLRSSQHAKHTVTASSETSTAKPGADAAGSNVAQGAAVPIRSAGFAADAAASQGSAQVQEPMEDPGSPLQMLAVLLSEQWAATSAAQLLACMCAAGPASCVQPMLEQGIPSTLCSCMTEIQDNKPGAHAALATLQLVSELGKHCADALAAAGCVPIILRMLDFCGSSAASADAGQLECSESSLAVRCAALGVLGVLCCSGDRQLCASVAQAALLPLVRWLCDVDPRQASNAAQVLAALLDQGVIDGTALDCVLQSQEHTVELLRLGLSCLPAASSDDGKQDKEEGKHNKQHRGASMPAVMPPAQGSIPVEEQEQQHMVHLTTVRLLRQCVQLDKRCSSALLAAGGLLVLVSMLSDAAAVVAAASTSTSDSRAVADIIAQDADSACTACSHSGKYRSSQLVMQYELLHVLDSLSLCHRSELVKANIIPIIVEILRQKTWLPADMEQQVSQQQQSAAAAGAATAGDEPCWNPPPTARTALPSAPESGVLSAVPRSRSSSMQGSSGAVGSGTLRTFSQSRSLTRLPSSRTGSSNKLLLLLLSPAAAAAAGRLSDAVAADLSMQCKIIACNLITVLAINNEVKRQLFHTDAVGPLMQMAELVQEGCRAQEAIKAALAQLGLLYLLPTSASTAAL